jgi:hypothetical protein
MRRNLSIGMMSVVVHSYILVVVRFEVSIKSPFKKPVILVDGSFQSVAAVARPATITYARQRHVHCALSLSTSQRHEFIHR